MIMVGFLAALIWGIGVAMGAPRRARWIMLALLMGAVIAAQLGPARRASSARGDGR